MGPHRDPSCAGWIKNTNQRCHTAIRSRDIGRTPEVVAQDRKRAEKEKQTFADLVGHGVDNPTIANGFSKIAVLRAVTPTITAVWLIDTIDSALGPQIPEVCNAEGDELLLCTAYYPFVAGTTTDDIRSALGRCPELRQENATFWNWISPEKLARALGKQKLPLKSQAFVSTLGDGTLVLGGLGPVHKQLSHNCHRSRGFFARDSQ